MLALLPLARTGVLAGGRVTGTAATGSSGGGIQPSLRTHHPLRAANLRAYKPLQHQHTPEVERILSEAGAPGVRVDWVPVSAPLPRGLLSVLFVDLPDGWDGERVHAAYEQAYADEPFVRLLPPSGRLPEVLAVKGTMTCEVAARVEGRTAVCVSALDNLTKGGAGQAVQSLNLMLGQPEVTGLDAPGLWP